MCEKPTYYTQRDVADALGVSRQVIKNWLARNNGKLPPADAKTVTGRPLWLADTVDEIKESSGEE